MLTTSNSYKPDAKPPKPKSKKLKSIAKLSERRLVEYFVVVTSLPRKTAEPDAKSVDASYNPSHGIRSSGSEDSDDDEYVDDYDFQPVITARYPLENHVGNALHESLTSFCHPTGSIRLRTERCMPKVHYFVMTGGKGQQIYGTCLTLWEPYMISARNKWKNSTEYNNEKGASKQKEVFLPKCLVILSTYPYLVAFREYLTQLHRMTKMGNMPLPVERYITNFCSEIPAPPPGSFEVQTTILDSVIKFWSPPNNQPIPWVSLPFSHLFECLDVDNVMKVWHALTLERQILLTSTQLSLLTVCCEILVSLLFPMRWSHAYIPVLPHFLIPILSAPMPYLCGLNKHNLSDALMDLSYECILVDLDTNQITMGPGTPPLPPLPAGHSAELSAKLEENAGMVFREARSLTKFDDYSERGAHLPLHVKTMADAMWESKLVLYDEAFHLAFTPEQARKNFLNGNDNSGIETSANDPFNPMVPFRIMTAAEKLSLRKQSQWDAVQEAFLNTYVFLLRNYRTFLVFPSKENEGSYGGAGFRSKDFVQSQRYDMQEVLNQLLGTQMFDDFVTKRLYGSGEADVVFFDWAVDHYLRNHGIMTNVAGHAAAGLRRFSQDTRNGGKAKCRGVAHNRIQSAPSTSMRSLFSRAGMTKKQYAPSSNIKDDDPLLQSARVHRKLKTVVPPEPSGTDLPFNIVQEAGSAVLTSIDDDDDDASVGSTNTTGTSSTYGTRSTGRSAPGAPLSPPLSPRSGYSSFPKLKQDHEGPEKEKRYRYKYPTFPTNFEAQLFGKPRPLPAAVLAEFDRQRENAAKFQRKKTHDELKPNEHLRRGHVNTLGGLPMELSSSAEVASFTVFFMAFTAVVGKELLFISDNPLSLAEDRTILSTYTHPKRDDFDSDSNLPTDDEVDVTSDEESAYVKQEVQDTLRKVDDDENITLDTMTTSVSGSGVYNGDGSFFDVSTEDDALSEGYHTTGTNESSVGSDPCGLDSCKAAGSAFVSKQSDSVASLASDGNEEEPRRRFRDSLSVLQIEEAKATAKAQLGLAFEMLKMMRERGLKADPVAYQCLIDACGRCGDTARATKLLARMHEDGIVADGVVYSCLVSAFSADAAWRKVSGKIEDDLPEWANGASVDMDWNKLQKRSIVDMARKRMGSISTIENIVEESDTINSDGSVSGKPSSRAGAAFRKGMESFRSMGKQDMPLSSTNGKSHSVVSQSNASDHSLLSEKYVSDSALRQILLGENLLEIVYPDISVDTDNELCPLCNTLLSDVDVVRGWTPSDSQDYTTKCPICPHKFVPHFCVQSTSLTFAGSRGLGTPLFCERLSPWVLEKELRLVMSDREGIKELLSPEWREKETKNATLWWNLVLTFMRYRFPFTFLLQGSFEQNLISPTPEDDDP